MMDFYSEFENQRSGFNPKYLRLANFLPETPKVLPKNVETRFGRVDNGHLKQAELHPVILKHL
jgi:hypothetical protein